MLALALRLFSVALLLPLCSLTLLFTFALSLAFTFSLALARTFAIPVFGSRWL
jgi:hypothetical protein